ncbi:MAG: amidohydrolase [Verrucomicrobia bacterium]|nr:amidohydrolase [Verrucomicrobiota bacterium]
MKNARRIFSFLLLGAAALPLRAANLAIVGETVHTMAGAALKNGVVLIRDGKIEAVGPAGSVRIPDDYRVLKAAVVTPGLIDAHATVGLSGVLNQAQDQDMWEKSSPMQPELRAIDAYNAKDPLVAWVRSFGVTTVNTGHAPTALISGQTMIVKTQGRTADQDVINPAAMTSVTLGRNGLTVAEGAPGTGGPSATKPPGTRAKAIAMLRADFIKAREYAQKREAKDESKRPGRDLHLEVLLRALDGSQPLLVTVNRQQDIISALRFAQEFKLKLVLDGCADAPMVLDAIKASGFPVVVHPTMQRSYEDMENLSIETAGRLHAAGIPIALQSSYEAYVPKTRVVLFEAAIAAANGLGFEPALASVTVDAARLLGIGDRTGSLERGKDADVALYDGDPFEYTAHCVGTVINGEVFADGPH